MRCRPRPGCAAVLIAVFALPAGPVAAGAPTPLSVIPTDSRPTTPVPPGAPMRVQLQAADLPRLAARLGVPAPDPGAAGLDYTVDGSTGVRPAAADRTWLESTFVIDHEDPRVLALRDQYRSEFPGAPSAATLARFVSARVQESSDQPFALASRVATLLRGDCTEHAVLTVALARSVGLPARVAFGLAIVPTEQGYGAFGHAWALVREGDRWVLSDAALLRMPVEVRYLTLGGLEDEGPGYALSVAELTMRWPQRVVVLGGADPR